MHDLILAFHNDRRVQQQVEGGKATPILYQIPIKQSNRQSL